MVIPSDDFTMYSRVCYNVIVYLRTHIQPTCNLNPKKKKEKQETLGLHRLPEQQQQTNTFPIETGFINQIQTYLRILYKLYLAYIF